MIIRREDLKRLCDCVHKAIDTSGTSLLTSSIGLVGNGNFLCARVTNREYFVETKVDLGEPIDFNATVDAQWFIKLVSKLTSDTVELNIDGNVVDVSADGKYKIPLIFDDGEMLELDEISIENIDDSFELSKKIIDDIIVFNAKEMTKVAAVKPIHKMCLLDEEGAITYNSGACVTSFDLPQNTKLLLSEQVVGLLKLFDSDIVKVYVGTDNISNSTSLTKIKFENDTTSATAILSCDDTLINSFPAAAIRGRANKDYPYTIEIKKDYLVSCLDRLLLFVKFNNTKEYGNFEFDSDKVTISGIDDSSKEFVYYDSSSDNVSYRSIINLEELKAYVDKCAEKIITLSFGDTQATVLTHGNIKNVIPEIHLN